MPTAPPSPPAEPAPVASKPPAATPSTSSRSTPPPIAASTKCASCARTSSYRPARDRYKVFIIDEAHQITNEAFNALLKTLEEPPEWVVFVLCTTEAHKIPTTIASRCQQFAFRSVDFQEIIGRMQWICEQESVTADAETFSVLAQAGEGSVRDSLSALDQAIACCGSELRAADVRGLLGMFSIESLHRVTEALSAADARRMLDIVQELERSGRNLQHFCRELARYFRNLLVTNMAGPGTSLVAASEDEQKQLAEIAASFSEEDLTRYLQLTLDLFRELQYSLQPRLHLEMGLLKLVHAGRLITIEEALAAVGGGGGGVALGSGGTSSAERPSNPPARQSSRSAPPLTAPKTAPRPFSPPTPKTETPENVSPPARKSAPVNGAADLKSRLLAQANEQQLTFIADAVEHADVAEKGNELQFIVPREFTLALRSAEMKKLVREVAGRAMQITVTVGESKSAPSPAAEGLDADTDEEATQRALAHPDVQRFQQAFPESHIRTVRNLKQ